MRITDTVIIGGGQAGLAASRCLADRGREHVVLERGRIGQRWHSDTWDSLHLLTPNWMNTLPGEAYRGPDPNGFSPAAAFGRRLRQYARSFGAPVEEDSAVRLLASGTTGSRSAPGSQAGRPYRSSNFIGGVGRDAAFVADHIAGRTAARWQPYPGYVPRSGLSDREA